MSSNHVSRIEDIYYIHDNVKYYIYFPYEWTTNMAPGTGPKQCKQCAIHGIIDDAFVGYCADCANYMYDMKRGHGFVFGKEQIDPNTKSTSALYTYLKYTRYYFEATNSPTISEKRRSSTQHDADMSIRTISTNSLSSCDDLLRKLSIASDSST